MIKKNLNENDTEELYIEIMSDCLTLIKKISHCETEKIECILKIGKNINKLLEVTNNSDILKKLSRDIFKTYGKLILPSKFLQYQQLYLNFSDIDNVMKKSEKIITELTVEALLNLTKQEKIDRSTKLRSNQYFLIIQKINKLLDKLVKNYTRNTITIEETFEIEKNLKNIQDKITYTIMKIQNLMKQQQSKLFDL